MVLLRIVLATTLLLPFIGLPIRGQTTIHGTLRGVALDPQGLAIVGVTVRVESAETGWRAETVTNPEGSYQFSRVTPGRYRLTTEKAGFQPIAQEGIVIALNEVSTVNL